MLHKNQEMLLQLVEEYWIKHPDVDFGQVLDNVLATRKGRKADLFYTSTAEWIHMFTNVLSEPEDFTQESLVALRGERYEAYHRHPEKFDREPKSLFINNEFSKENYIGGDDIIHLFFNVVFAEGQLYGSTQVEKDGETLQLSYESGYTYNGEEHLHNFFINLHGINIDTLNGVMHSAIFKIRDTNDQFQTAWFNGKMMNEVDYIFLLNAIQKSGFDFRIGDFTNTKIDSKG